MKQLGSSCPTPAELLLLVSGEPQDTDEFETHVASCDQCQQALDSIAGEVRPDGELPPSLSDSHNSQLLSQVLKTAKQRNLEHDAGGGIAEANGPRSGELTNAHGETSQLQPAPMPVQFGPYQVLGKIGQGGMGVVYKAFDDTLQREVAIKTLLPRFLEDDGTRQRFLAEARAAAKIQHANVVAIYAVEEFHGRPYLVQQFIEGQSLDHILAQRALSITESIRLASDITRGLAAAHRQGIVHRDIKPANILIASDDGRALVSDFGLARVLDQPGLTQSGAIAGTPEYLSPEQARGKELDGRSDLFCVGTVLYQALSQESPFRAGNPWACIQRVCQSQPTAIDKVRADAPAWFAAVIKRLMSKTPRQRFDSAEQLLTVLESQTVTSITNNSWSNPLRSVLAVVVVAACLGLMYVVMKPNVAAPDSMSTTPSSAKGRPDVQVSPDAQAGPAVAERSGDVPARSRVAFITEDIAYETLGDAVANAKPGGTIEVAASGRIPCAPLEPIEKDLTIRAATGHVPILTYDVTNPPNRSLLVTTGDLSLEGLEIDWAIHTDSNFDLFPVRHSIIRAQGDKLRIAYCRMRVGAGTVGCAAESLETELVGCEIDAPTTRAVHWDTRDGATFIVRDSILSGASVITVPIWKSVSTAASEGRLRLEHSTIRGSNFIELMFKRAAKHKTVVEAEATFFNVRHLNVLRGPVGAVGFRSAPDRMGQQLFQWSRDAGNAYADDVSFFSRRMSQRNTRASEFAVNLRAWSDFWHFGEVSSVMVSDPTQLPSGIGQKTHFVGPGEPYEQWKKESGS